MYVRCYTCGCSLGDKYDYFIAVKEQKFLDYIKKKYPNDDLYKVRELLEFDRDSQILVGDILDSIEIKRECCRRLMISYHQSRKT